MDLKNLLPFDGRSYIKNNFLNEKLAKNSFNQLLEKVNWQSRKIKMFGKLINQPRLMCWMGDKGVNYKYSGVLFEPEPWIKEVMSLKKNIEQNLNFEFNSALLNLYRDEKDSMGLHSDDEKELGPAPLIASISLGAERRLIFRHKQKKEKVIVKLNSGSLLVMQGLTQKNWIHEVPKKNLPSGPRINITLRKIIN